MHAIASNINKVYSVLFSLIRRALGDRLSSAHRVDDLSELEWQDMLDLSFNQGVSAICVDGYNLVLESGSKVDSALESNNLEDCKYEWFSSVIRTEEEFKSYIAAAGSLSAIYEKNGLRTYVLKGLVFSECYPIPSHRMSCDFDCYIPDGYESGNQIVEQMGVKVDRDYFKNSSFVYKGLFVENHCYFTAFRGRKKTKEYERLLQREIISGEPRQFFGSNLLAPPVMFSALFCISHAQTHFLTEGITLRHICDWALFRKRHYDEIDWKHFESVCREYGMWSFAQTVTRIGSFLLGEGEYADLTETDLRLLDDTLHRTSEEKMSGMKRRVQLIMKSLRSGWKYKYFSDQNVFEHVIQRVVGYFEKPKLD